MGKKAASKPKTKLVKDPKAMLEAWNKKASLTLELSESHLREVKRIASDLGLDEASAVKMLIAEALRHRYIRNVRLNRCGT